MEFYKEIYKLKTLIRKGWGVAGVKSNRIESVAEHTFSMMILAMNVMKDYKVKLDELKVYKMILVHDVCEIDAGDTTPYDEVSSSEKYKNEEKCIVRLAEEYKIPELISLWKEYEEQKSDEAKFVKKIDKLDMVLQSKIYAEQQGEESIFAEFYENSKQTIEEFEVLI